MNTPHTGGLLGRRFKRLRRYRTLTLAPALADAAVAAAAAAAAADDDYAREDAAAAPGRPFDSDKARGAESGRSRPRSKPKTASMNLTLRGCHAAEL